jgi:hypothetical protein
MKKLTQCSALFVAILCMSGCAVSYRPINPSSINYAVHDVQDGLELSYKYDVLSDQGNRKYAKKETNNGIKVIAVKITNHRDTTIIIGRTAAFYNGANKLDLLAPQAVKSVIKQNVPGYLPYLLLTFVNLYVSTNGEKTTYPIGLVLGPAVTGGNMAVAGVANKNLLKDLTKYDIMNQDIKKGETAFGVIGIRQNDFVPLSLKMVK